LHAAKRAPASAYSAMVYDVDRRPIDQVTFVPHSALSTSPPPSAVGGDAVREFYNHGGGVARRSGSDRPAYLHRIADSGSRSSLQPCPGVEVPSKVELTRDDVHVPAVQNDARRT
jgi:hypothetical protein